MGREERELGGIERRETKIKIYYVRKNFNKILKSFLKKKKINKKRKFRFNIITFVSGGKQCSDLNIAFQCSQINI